MLQRILAWVLLALTCYTASSNAQTINYTTGNLINPANWTGTAYGNLPGDCCTGGPSPLYNNQLGGGGISFSYGQATVGQNINLSQAITGSGLFVKGYNYHWHITTNSANGVDPVYGQVSLLSKTNSPLETFNYSYTTAMNETVFQGTQNFSRNYSLAEAGSLNVSFTGRDQGFWAGYYGPKVNHIIVSANYGVDPCATNPAYSTNCSGFNSVVFSNNLVPNPSANVSWGGFANNSFAINQALTNAGSGLMVHGFDYGFKANVSGSYCAFELITCWDNRYPSANVGVNITDKTGASLYSVNHNINWDTVGLKSFDYQYRFPSSQQYGNLGNFNFTTSTNDSASVGYMYARMAYTPDACMINPQSSPTCPGFVIPTTTTAAVYTAPTTTVVQASPTTTSTSSVNVGGVELSTSGTISAPDGVPTEAKAEQSASTTTSTTQANAATQTSTASVASSTSTQQEQTKTSSSPNMSLIMSTIGKIQAADKATQAAAVQNANSVVMTSVAKSQEQAMAVVDNLNTMSASSSQASQVQTTTNTQVISVTGGQTNVNSGTVAVQGPTVMSVQALMNMASQTSNAGSITYQPPPTQNQIQVEANNNTNTSSTGISLNRNSLGISISANSNSSIQNTQTPSITSYTPTYTFSQPVTESKAVEILTPPILSSFNPANRTNPINDAMESKPLFTNSSVVEQRMDSVNKNVKNNELAGGVDITSIAVLPVGFNAYSVTLRDVAFYKQEEIYTNQKTVDNVRLLRGLTGASDAKHQEMVNSQYK